MRLSDAEKMAIIERFENGERKSDIARDLGMNKSTIGAIIKRRAEKIWNDWQLHWIKILFHFDFLFN